ncbi:septum formation initiator family protein [Sphaerotilus montanus]|uniref:Cell division protein FtsB n=1 Tax=Sphaerotilus montanus TaxID=522889 RepID=A0A7Y9QXG6_9BURK|nr:septum formation initiator family protein [Sphaerotilus montanus]NYG31568.1 cell division protein FtsB [Sphaerotilus montanus]NZD57920.1 septum formation initiator family protein [Sphaerotilus montanus]
MSHGRVITVLLLALLGLVHAELWFGNSGTPRVRELSAQVADQQARNAAARVHNDQLQAELKDLKEGLEIIEESARFELGMVKPDEILVQYPQATRAN